MDEKTYKSMTAKQMKGRKIKTKVPIHAGPYRVPEGTICTITDKQGGLFLIGMPCENCGIQLTLSKIDPIRVDLLPIGS